jgi:hypothetical protein
MAGLGCLVGAAPATAHTIDARGAAAAARTAAETLGQVDHARCWRPLTAIHARDRHHAVCVAWWVHTPGGESCAVFYQVKLVRRPSRRLSVTQTHDPWCTPAPAPTRG